MTRWVWYILSIYALEKDETRLFRFICEGKVSSYFSIRVHILGLTPIQIFRLRKSVSHQGFYYSPGWSFTGTYGGGDIVYV